MDELFLRVLGNHVVLPGPIKRGNPVCAFLLSARRTALVLPSHPHLPGESYISTKMSDEKPKVHACVCAPSSSSTEGCVLMCGCRLSGSCTLCVGKQRGFQQRFCAFSAHGDVTQPSVQLHGESWHLSSLTIKPAVFCFVSASTTRSDCFFHGG